jgi:predicted nucleic acid-binding protein
VTVFVDTSAILAFVHGDDLNHDRAVDSFSKLLRNEELVTHNYVVLETIALVQARLGLDAARGVIGEVFRSINIVWVDENMHEAATTALLAARKRHISLVDWTSFEVMRRSGIDAAFGFDRHFSEQGFVLIPKQR